MRDFKGMKRQRNRNRRSGGGGQGGQNNNPNRSLDSTGPEGIKVRGNAQTVYERYQQLARDATSSGDRILAENYLQHAEHYFRLLRIMQPNRPVAEIAARDGSNQGFDIDFESNRQSGGWADTAAHPTIGCPRYEVGIAPITPASPVRQWSDWFGWPAYAPNPPQRLSPKAVAHT